ncbi:DUF2207 domain-containing protein [Streptomyces sp. NPDC059894]|uniref:DUF2207 domain-containing protein n=1 Tax=unclassified Streptomyces TaxID=2593676 RepID=UPI003657F02E
MRTEQGSRPWAAENLTRARRVVAPVKIFFVVLLLGGLVALFRATGNVERVDTMWVGAEVAADGSLRVTEVIDYDFGYPGTTRHGIYRDLPDLPYDEDAAGIVVTMDGARVPWELTVGDDHRFALRLRAWELQTRTPRGTALWLRTEAFRRYLLDPPPRRDGEPLDEEAERVELCTAWSMSLQAEYRWQQAVADSTAVPRRGAAGRSRIGPALALGLVAAVGSSTAPSSGGGGGGGDGGGGGGGDGGGGGGGSW